MASPMTYGGMGTGMAMAAPVAATGPPMMMPSPMTTMAAPMIATAAPTAMSAPMTAMASPMAMSTPMTATAAPMIATAAPTAMPAQMTSTAASTMAMAAPMTAMAAPQAQGMQQGLERMVPVPQVQTVHRQQGSNAMQSYQQQHMSQPQQPQPQQMLEQHAVQSYQQPQVSQPQQPQPQQVLAPHAVPSYQQPHMSQPQQPQPQQMLAQNTIQSYQQPLMSQPQQLQQQQHLHETAQMMQHPSNIKQEKHDVDLHLDHHHHTQPPAVKARQAALGMNEPRLDAFVDQSEFIGLGCYCAITNAFAQLGLRYHAYPFDWNRSPARGIIHSFNNRFADFLTYSSTADGGPEHGVSFQNTAWGGSFWHHNIAKPEVAEVFQRRIGRILGEGDVSPTITRIFVRTLNSSEEILEMQALYDTLRRAFPRGKVYLLVLIDMQDDSGPIRIAGQQNDNLLFYRIPIAAAFTNTLDERSHGYWEPMVFAFRYWAIRSCPVVEVPSLAMVKAACNAFDGGNPATELYHPARLPGSAPTALPQAVRPAPTISAQGTLHMPEALPPVPKLSINHAKHAEPHPHGFWMDANGHRHAY